MLKAIEIENFKCFEHLKLRCAPLTVLCGLNGMGKSSVFQALMCLRGLGSFRTLGTPQDVLYESAATERLSFKLSSTNSGIFNASFRISGNGRGWTDEGRERARATPPYDDEGNELRVEDALMLEDQKWFFPHLMNIVHVGAERIGPRKIYDYWASSGTSSLEGKGEGALRYIRDHQSDLLDETDARCTTSGGRGLRGVLNHWLQQVTPGAHLNVDDVQDADALIAGISFDRPGDVRTRRYRMTNVGFGLAYVLPVLAALLVPREHLCLIENPEAHLHPRGQVRLAELAARAAIAGVQVMVETHSDHFLDGVRIAVREQLIRPQDTAIHYFERDGGKSVVVTPEIDEDGRLSHWPAGFFDQRNASLARLLAPK